MFVRGTPAICLALALVACNGSDSGTPDAGDVDAAPFMLCGNFILEGTEECDDGNTDPDDGCSGSCVVECGDGSVSGTELCDPGIPEGDTGACPTEATCTDS